jgi:hypothetical protein
MKGSILKYILVVSLLMNFSLLGAAGYTHYKKSHYRPLLPFGQELYKGGNHLFQELALKPDQLNAFQQKALPFHANIAKKRLEVDRLRTELFGLMRADNPDQKALAASITHINREQEDMQRMVVSHMLEFKAMLDKDQQKKFLDLIETAMGQRREMQCP